MRPSSSRSTAVYKHAVTFLDAFREVSEILGVNNANIESIFNVDETLDEAITRDDVFMKIIVSLHMNTDDPGLDRLKRMSMSVNKGISIEEVVGDVSRRELQNVVGLCTDVSSGIKYTLRGRNNLSHPDPLEMFTSFIEYLEMNLDFSKSSR